MIRRILSLCLAVFISVTLFGVYPAYAEDDAGKNSGGAVPAMYFTASVFAASADFWKVDNKTLSSLSGKYVRIQGADGTASVSAAFEGGISSAGYKEIGVFARSLSGDAEITFSVICGGKVSKVTAAIPAGEEYYIFTPLPISGYVIDEVHLTALSNGTKDSKAASVMLSGMILSDTDHTENIKRYSAFSLTGLGDDGLVEKDGEVCGLSMVADSDDISYAVVAEIRGNTGSVTLRYCCDGKDYGIYGSKTVIASRTKYQFAIGNIPLHSSFILEFIGPDDANFYLDSLQLVPIPSYDTDSTLGTVTKCSVSEEAVNVSGSITRDAAVKYIDGKVCLYEIPLWASFSDVLSAEPAMSINMSTSFSFALPITQDYSVFTAYTVAIKDKSGVHPLSAPMYPSFGGTVSSAEDGLTVLGLTPEDAFSGNCDRLVLDVDIKRLITDSRTSHSVLFTYDGYPFYIDNTYFTELQHTIQFTVSAGIDIIFRLKSDSTPKPSNADYCRRIAAVVSYLDNAFEPVGFIDAQPYGDNAVVCTAEQASVAKLISAVSGGRTVYTVMDTSSVEDDIQTAAWLFANTVSRIPGADLRILLTGEPDTAVSDGINACASDDGYGTRITILKSGSDVPSESLYPVILDFSKEGSSDISVNNDIAIPAQYNTPLGDTKTVLWDFTKAYHSGGFAVTAGPTAIFTEIDPALEEYTGISACRCLSTVLSDDSRMIVARPTAPLILSTMPEVSLLLSVHTDSVSAVDIVFVSETGRAVFTAEFNGSGIYTPLCDLSDSGITGQIERIALVLRKGESVRVGIAKISAVGNSDTENTGVFVTEPVITNDAVEEAYGAGGIDKAVLAVGGLVAVTLLVFTVLSRKNEE